MNTATVESTELETLLNELRGNTEAESAARMYYGCYFVDFLNLNQAREIAKAIRGEVESTPVQVAEQSEPEPTPPGHCFECGAKCGRSQCQPCKEGMTRSEYGHTYGHTAWGL